MTDLVALQAVHDHPGVVMTTVELAAALGVAQEEAEARIATLKDGGYLTGPMQSRSTGGEWSEIGFKLTANGRYVLGVE